ncbi:MAG TPA: polysaccharide deacetylase family protein [Alphaproteobacteria bacterium]|jgi:peptidoglycan/xylan/chitin deacetylase (PgdA/CDA1 family)
MTPRRYGPFPYSPIIDRPKTRWPNGARVALWVVPNIEFFALDEQVPAAAGGGGKTPDVPTWAARDYGNRVGVFRMMDVMSKHGVRGTVALNSELCAEHPRIIEECNRLKWELMGHNESNTRRLNSVAPEEEAGIVKRTVETIAKASGQTVKGWLSSGLSETWNSLDHLVDSGVEYVADWVNDDQPYPMTLDDGRSIMSIPYTTQLNDKPAFEHRHRTAEEFDVMIRRQFDTLYAEGAEQARAMCIALHPYITGVPHRIGALDSALGYICKHEGVWLATGSEIAAAGRTLWP